MYSNEDPILHIGASMIATATTEESMLLGFAYGRLAIRIIESHVSAPEVACCVYGFFASNILPWHRPLADSQRYFLAAINKGLETYDTMSTSIAVIDRAVFGFFAGESLDLVLAKLEEAIPLVKRDTGRHWLAMPAKMIHRLRGMEVKEELGGSTNFDHDIALLKAQEYRAHTHLFRHHFYQMLLATFTGQTDVGLSHAKACEIYHTSAGGSFFSGMYVFYSAVLFLDNQDTLVQSEQTLLRQKMDLLLLWSKTCPSTFEHKYKFLRAMQARKDLDPLNVLDAFDEAIFLALESGMLPDAALFAEQCSRWLSSSSPNRSWQYQDFARRQYDFWGASAKVKELTELIAIRRTAFSLRGFCNYPRMLKLTLAILPSPSPKDESRDPFTHRRLSDDHLAHSPVRLRSTPGNNFNEMYVRPSLGRGNSTTSIHSSSTDDESRRKVSGLTSTCSPRDSDIGTELDLQSVMRASLAIQEDAQVQNIILKLVRIIMQTAGANYGVVMLREQNLEKKTLQVEVIGEGNKVSLVDHKPLYLQSDVVPARLCEYGLFSTEADKG